MRTWTYESAQLHLARLSLGAGQEPRALLAEITDIAADVLGVARVSIWLFQNEGQAIRCDFLRQPERQEIFEGVILYARDFPSYFRAVKENRVVSVRYDDEAQLSEELAAAYCRPLGITALLDAPIYQSGELVGIVCHEHIGPPRGWTDRDREFASFVADTIARLYAEDAHARAEDIMRAYQAQAGELHRIASLGRLAAGMAHDFKNLLTAIYGFADLIAEATTDDPYVAGLVKELHNAAERATNLTQELLTLGRGQRSRPSIVDVGALIERCRELLAATVGGHVTLEVDVAPMLSRVFIDPTQLERTILNLAVNARDAMPDGGVVKVTVREARVSAHTSGEATYVIVDVTDTGCGIERTALTQIFEPFYTTKGEAGTGLGLAIVRQLIGAAGGFVEVDSAPGRGTRVSVHLPRIAAAA
ncbi:MAG: ATP-binding protein [Chloroflexota bacterium]